MEIITYTNQTWEEIPEQDNPAFDYKNKRKERHNRALMITKVLPYEAKSVGDSGYVVIEVPLQGDVIRLGLFWNLKNAEIFARAYINQ